LKYLNKYYAYITILFVFIIYLLTLAPSVMQIDTGELAAVQANLGIAHPTGYPLFTILGYLFLKLPLPFTKIYMANLLAAIYCTGALFLFLKTIIFLLNNVLVHGTQSKEKKKKNIRQEDVIIPNEIEKIFIAVCTLFMLAFNSTFWQQSNSTEVYSLQALLFSIILFVSIRFYFKPVPAMKDYLFLAGSVALGFTNHMTTLLLVPGLIYLFFAKTGFSKEAFKKILVMFLLFAAIITFMYSYLMIRAAQNPQLNWGNTISLENLIRHVSGKQYQVWMFSSLENAKAQFVNYITGLPAVFAYIPLLFALAGIVRLFKLNRKLFTFLIITYIFSVLYTINYSIHDIESYFLLSYMILAIFGAFGIAHIYNWLKNKIGKPVAASAAFIPVGLLVITLNYGKSDYSGTYVYEDYCKSILNSVPQNSVVFSYQWDYFVASSYYFRFVEGYRRDVTVIDKELLRRSWYYNQLEADHASVIANLKPEIASFLEAVKPFEQSKLFDADRIELRYQAIMTNLVTQNMNGGGFYIAPELAENELQNGQFKLPEGTALVPYGFLFKAVKGNEYVQGPVLDFKIRFPKERDTYAAFIYNQTANMLIRRAMYELSFGKKDKAGEIVSKLRSDMPEVIIPDQVLSGLK